MDGERMHALWALDAEALFIYPRLAEQVTRRIIESPMYENLVWC